MRDFIIGSLGVVVIFCLLIAFVIIGLHLFGFKFICLLLALGIIIPMFFLMYEPLEEFGEFIRNKIGRK